MNSSRLFNASRVALVVTSLSFALRGAAMGAWENQFHLNNTQVGWIANTAFWGFTIAMMLGGPLCDIIGMGRFMVLAFVGHLAGIVLTVTASGYWGLYCATLSFGIANGAVEAVCNPLITTLYPDEKTTKLNQFHVWFPGGAVLGGIWAYLAGKAGWGWQVQFAGMLIPLVIYGLMFFGQSFPATERVQKGVSTGGMWRACLSPGFLVMVACMLLTASTEFGPNQWIPTIFNAAGAQGALVFVCITALMALGRQFAGTFVHRMPAAAVLCLSAVLSALGLLIMSRGSGPMLYLGSVIFAAGVCFFWPTMLGRVSERYPSTGALGLAVMGGAGMLSAGLVLPLIGHAYDARVSAGVPPEMSQATLAAAGPGTPEAAQWTSIQAHAGLQTLLQVAIMPAILAVVFFAMLAFERKQPSPDHALSAAKRAH